MKISESIVKKILITKIEDLDPITVIVEDFSPGSGKIIIECFGESWSHYWSHMGEGYTLQTFFIKASEDYLVGKLCQGEEYESDWHGLSLLARERILKLRRQGYLSRSNARDYYVCCQDIVDDISASNNSEALDVAFDDDWAYDIPQKETREYKYLTKIVRVVKEAFKINLNTQEKI